MFLLPKHDRVIEIENDPAIGALEQAELEFVEADRFEKNHGVMPARFSQNAEPLANARTARRDYRGLDAESRVVIETVPQPQTRARRIAVFDYAEDFHQVGEQIIQVGAIDLNRPPKIDIGPPGYCALRAKVGNLWRNGE